MADASSSGTPTRGDIEGLRAVAVGTVVAFHAGLPGMSGGFIGVDVFFVISGYLITSLLLREVEATGRVSLASFYARRARRLLPAASLVLIATGIAAWILEPPNRLADLSTDLITATFYVVNWGLAARSVDYLAEDAAPSLVQHYWSLSVEEQFYVVWPALIVFGLWVAARGRLRRRRVIGWLLTLVAIGSFAWSVHLTGSDPARAYFVTTTRLWELAIGALLAFGAVRAARLPRRVAEALALAGLAAVIASALLLSTSTPWPGSAAALPTLGAAAIIAGGVGGSTWAGSVLSWPPFVFIGGLSYSIYLWHWPVIRLGESALGMGGAKVGLALALVSVALAWVTKHLVEDPVRYARALRKPAASLAMAAVLMAATTGLGVAMGRSLPTLGQSTVPGAAALAAGAEQGVAPAPPWTMRADPEAAYTASGPLEPDPAIATQDIPAYYADGCQVYDGDTDVNLDCRYGDPKGKTTLALLGDSKTGQWADTIDSIARGRGWRMDLYLKSACGFATSVPTSSLKAECQTFAGNVLDLFESDPDRRPDVVIVSSGTHVRPGLVDGMAGAIERLQDLGVQVIIMQNSHNTKGAMYECAATHESDYRACDFAPPKTDGELLREVAAKTGAPIIDLNEWLCPTVQACPVAIGGALVYRQGSHVTVTYLNTLRPVLDTELTRLVATPS